MTSLTDGRQLGLLLSGQDTCLSELLTALGVYSEHVPFGYILSLIGFMNACGQAAFCASSESASPKHGK